MKDKVRRKTSSKITLWIPLALVLMGLASGINGGIATLENTSGDRLPNIIQNEGEKIATKIEAPVDYLVAIVCFFTASFLSKNTATNQLVFRTECSVLPGIKYPAGKKAPQVLEIASAFNSEEDGMIHLIGFICEHLNINNPVIEQIKFTCSADKLILSVKAFFEKSTSEQEKELCDQILKLAHHKIEAATEMNLNSGLEFGEAVHKVIDAEIKAGSAELKKVLAAFSLIITPIIRNET